MTAARAFARRFASRPSGAVALAWLALVVGAVGVAPLLPGLPDPLAQDLFAVLQGPSGAHPLGTDESGRDVLARLLHGGRVDLVAAATAATIAFVIGVPLGALVGFVGGRVDGVLMRVVESVQSLPGIVVLSAVIAVLGRGVWSATVALGIGFSFLFVHVTRTEVRAAVGRLYVRSAVTLGVPPLRIAVRHVLPNVAPTLLVTLTTVLGTSLLTLAGLSLLGLGAQPPAPSWGGMLQQATQNMYVQFFAIVPPGVALATVVLACNTVADRARDSLAAAPDRSVAGAGGLALHVPRAPAGADRAPTGDAPAPDAPTPDTAAAGVLDLRGLRVRRGGRALVDGVDLAVAPGEIVGLVGRSGSGKTTTALTVAGLLPPGLEAEADRLLLHGVDLRTLRGGALRRAVSTGVGIVFQDPTGSLDPSLTVGRQVAAPLRRAGLSRAAARTRVGELLDEVGIVDPARVAAAYPHELSGGMAQRVVIAGALASRPALLIADEPTTALDVTVQRQVLELLRRIRDEHGTAILFITHDLAVVAELCDRVAVMHGGVVVEDAPTDRLFAGPRHPRTAELLGLARRSVPAPGAADRPPAPVELVR